MGTSPQSSETPGQTTPVSELLSRLGEDGYRLLCDEFALATAEVQDSVADVGEALAVISVGAALLTGALLAFLAAAVLGLGMVLPYWASALIIGGAVLVVAVIVLLIGRSKLQLRKLAPERIQTTARRDAEMVMNQVSR